MAHLIQFTSTRFDVSKEKPNDVNPIAGQSVLSWLRDELVKMHFTVTEPATEDWGWYIDVVGPSASYLVGASADAEDTNPAVEWILQVHRSRSLKDKLLGRNKMTADDPLFALIEKLVRADTRSEQIEVTLGD